MGGNMRKIILLFWVLFVTSFVFAITDGCGDEVDVNTACVIRTPPITCSTYDLYNSSNELNIDDGTMSEVVIGSGVYNFTFIQPDFGIHTIVLCDNTSTNINIEVTDQSDLATIIEGIQTNATDVKINVSNNAEEIKVNVTTTDFASAVWGFTGTIVDNILSQFINFLFGSITTGDSKTFNDSMSQIDTINETTYYIEQLI